jgi:hypothetical protein
MAELSHSDTVESKPLSASTPGEQITENVTPATAGAVVPEAAGNTDTQSPIRDAGGEQIRLKYEALMILIRSVFAGICVSIRDSREKFSGDKSGQTTLPTGECSDT